VATFITFVETVIASPAGRVNHPTFSVHYNLAKTCSCISYRKRFECFNWYC